MDRRNGGMHSNKELQKDWKENEKNTFVIEILENLEYHKEESITGSEANECKL